MNQSKNDHRNAPRPLTTDRRTLLVGASALVGSGAVAGVGLVAPAYQQGAAAQEATPTAVPSGAPPEVNEHAADWPLPNRDYGNTRATMDAAISADNAQQLGIAWTFSGLGTGLYGAVASNPIVVGDTVYLQDLASNLFALDRETGEVRWEQRYDTSVVGPNGPAIGWGKVFAGVGNDTVVALDIETGEEQWSVEVPGPTGYQQPAVYDEFVYVGTGTRGYAAGVSGMIIALNQETGDIAWEFQAVEEGFWGAPEINSGAGVWYPPAIDAERGLTFWGTGNPAPFPGIVGWPNASSRPGPNLYSNSTLALDHASGELVWYHQANPRDVFDLDFQAPRVLASATIDGETRDLVIGAGKLGRVIAYDRESGDVLWDTPVGKHQNDDLDGVPPGEEIEVLPGVYGGVETPMAFADGVLYVPVVNLAARYTATGHEAVNGSQAVQNAEQQIDLESGTGEIVALDVASGEILWSHAVESLPFGGATVVNDLVVASTFDGAIFALARESGEEVWSAQVAVPIIAWPAVVGNTLLVAAGASDNAALTAFRLGAETAATPVATPMT